MTDHIVEEKKMFKYILLPLIVAGALLVPAKPAAAYRGYYGYGYRAPRAVVRPYYYGPRRAYVAPRVVVRPTNFRAPIYAAPNAGYYQPNGYYQSYGW
jgi:hypothetical protein